jgi:hypothetical protein
MKISIENLKKILKDFNDSKGADTIAQEESGKFTLGVDLKALIDAAAQRNESEIDFAHKDYKSLIDACLLNVGKQRKSIFVARHLLIISLLSGSSKDGDSRKSLLQYLAELNLLSTSNYQRFLSLDNKNQLAFSQAIDDLIQTSRQFQFKRLFTFPILGVIRSLVTTPTNALTTLIQSALTKLQEDNPPEAVDLALIISTILHESGEDPLDAHISSINKTVLESNTSQIKQLATALRLYPKKQGRALQSILPKRELKLLCEQPENANALATLFLRAKLSDTMPLETLKMLVENVDAINDLLDLADKVSTNEGLTETQKKAFILETVNVITTQLKNNTFNPAAARDIHDQLFIVNRDASTSEPQAGTQHVFLSKLAASSSNQSNMKATAGAGVELVTGKLSTSLNGLSKPAARTAPAGKERTARTDGPGTNGQPR